MKSNIVAVIGVLIVGGVLEYMRRTFGIPISIVDVLITPMSVLLCYMMLIEIKKNISPKDPKDLRPIENVSLAILVGLFFVTVLFLAGGGYIIWSLGGGLLQFFDTKNRLGMHGYSLVLSGLVLCFIGAFTFVMFIRTIATIIRGDY